MSGTTEGPNNERRGKLHEQADIRAGYAWVVDTDIRELTRRTRGHRLADIVAELRTSLLGWKAYFGMAEVLSPLRETDKWLRRKLRCYIWKQWGRSGYRELRKRGVTVREAWNTSKSAHGPWRLSKTPALSRALPARVFSSLGLPSLAG